MLKRVFGTLFLLKAEQKGKIPKQEHIKSYMIIKLRLKCFLKIRILLWFALAIFKNLALRFALLHSDAELTAQTKQVSRSNKPNKGHTKNLGPFLP